MRSPFLAVALVVGLGSACSSNAPPSPVSGSRATSSTADRASWSCPTLVTTPLPAWAAANFASPEAPPGHLVGLQENIAAVPFGWPLQDRPSGLRQNKILWIARTGSGPLHIVATEQAAGRTATRELAGGPGPSIVDMPAAGCWRFALSWNDQHDEVFIRYYGAPA